MTDLFPSQNFGMPEHQELNEGASFSNNSSMDYFEILSSILVTIAKGEHIVQCIREVLVQDPSFTPMSLFKYLAKNDRQIRCHNLTAFLQENSLATNEKQMERLLGRVFSRYNTNKDNIQYSQFIKFIYPWNTGVLRDVTVNRLKNYQKIDKIQRNVRPSDSVLTAFLLLIDHEMLVEKKIEAQLADPRFPTTKQFRKVIKSIKKASQKICSTLIEQSSSHISMLELRNFIKAFIQVPEYLFVYLSRRLSMNRSGLIALQTLDNVFKKSKKTSISNKENEELMNMHKEQFEKHKLHGENSEKYEKENNYRDQLYVELSEALNISPHRNRTPRNKSYSQSKRTQNFNRKTPAKKQFKKQGLPFYEDSQPQPTRTPIQNLSSNYKFDRLKQKPQNEPNEQRVVKEPKAKVNDEVKYVNRIFKEYVQIYLKGYKEIEKCKMKLVSNKKIDFLSLFKSLDHGTGAINATDIRNLYVRLSGIPTNYDFELIIRRFSQQDEEWLSYSEFIEIFKPSNTNDFDAETIFLESNRMGLTKSVDLSPQNMRSLSQILYLTLDVEHCLSAVLEKLSRQQVEILFCQIACQEQTAKGFINYQELKKYIVERLEISANMSDTMALLKRFDRSKNGVVVKEQFLHF